MSEPTPRKDFDGEIIDLIIEADKLDTTIRPCSPERRAALEAEREKLRRWREEKGDNLPDYVDLILDAAKADMTVRPCPPERRAALEAEREKIRRWREATKPAAEQPPAADSGDGKQSA
jgi:hypothetical protein